MQKAKQMGTLIIVLSLLILNLNSVYPIALSTEKNLYIDIVIKNDGSILLKEMSIKNEGTPKEFYRDGEYSIFVRDINGNALYSDSFFVSFALEDYKTAHVFGEEDSSATVDEAPVTFIIKYNDRMDLVEIQKNGKVVLSKKIPKEGQAIKDELIKTALTEGTAGEEAAKTQETTAKPEEQKSQEAIKQETGAKKETGIAKEEVKTPEKSSIYDLLLYGALFAVLVAFAVYLFLRKKGPKEPQDTQKETREQVAQALQRSGWSKEEVDKFINKK